MNVIKGTIVADDPRTPLEQAVDELIEAHGREKRTGFVIGDLCFPDVTFTVIFAMHDGNLITGPMLMPGAALPHLRDQINLALGHRAVNDPPAPSVSQ